MSPLHVGCCISAHGFGHAARAIAVMESLSRLSEIELTIATMVPEWFLRSSYSGHFSYNPMQTDVGLVQQNPLEEDIPATLTALSGYYPVQPQTAGSLGSVFSKCDFVVCDISPAGLMGAQEAGVPAVLLENFTWDWIYEGYVTDYPEMGPFIEYLRQVNDQADYRVQALPICNPAAADLVVPPIARAFREDRGAVRCRLQIVGEERVVLVSMGGFGIEQLPLDCMQARGDTVFVISGYTGEMIRADNLRFLSADTDIFHPDLVAASDAVIGKVGYSTLAEIYHADVPFGYVSRPGFRESGPLTSFIQEEMSGLEFEAQEFRQGEWVNKLSELFHLETKGTPEQNGADRCAQFLLTQFAR